VPGLAVLERRVDKPVATVICVHGGLDRGGSFARLARRLRDVDVVTYDRRGYQGSRDVQPVGLAHHVADLSALASNARSGPVVVFGHSYGGVVAISTAVAHPALVDLVVVYETPLPWVYRRPGSLMPVGDDPDFEAEQFFRRVVSDATWERLSEADKESRRGDGIALLDDLGVLRGPVPFDISKLNAPLSYGYGDAVHAEYYEALTNHLKVVVPSLRVHKLAGAGHGAHLANPDLLSSFITTEREFACE